MQEANNFIRFAFHGSICISAVGFARQIVCSQETIPPKFMRLARESFVLHANVSVRLAADNTVRKRSKQELFNIGSCIISRKRRICEEYLTSKTQKMSAGMECESVEISGFLQVRFEL